MQRHDTVVADRLLETYIWAILPTQAPDAPTYTPRHLNTGGTTDDLVARTGTKISDNSQLATTRSSTLIGMDLSGPIAPVWASGM